MNKKSETIEYQTGELFEVSVDLPIERENNSGRKAPLKFRVSKLYEIPLDEIEPDIHQARKFFDSEKLDRLTESIRAKGVLQPILLQRIEEKNVVVAGERRLRAAKQAGLRTIPAMFVLGDVAELSLIENLQREDLNPIEEAEALARLVEERGYKDIDLVPIIGKAKSTISEIKKLNQLPESIKDECRNSGEWSRNVLLEIAKQPTEEAMIRLFQQVKSEGLKGEQLRQITRDKSPKPKGDSVVRFVNNLKMVTKSFRRLDFETMEDRHREVLRDELLHMKEQIDAALAKFD